MTTPRKEKLVPCRAPLPNGDRCSRPAEPGYSCGFHEPSPKSADRGRRSFSSSEVPFVVGEPGSLTDDGPARGA